MDQCEAEQQPAVGPASSAIVAVLHEIAANITREHGTMMTAAALYQVANDLVVLELGTFGCAHALRRMALGIAARSVGRV